ncbi:hypothetical protein EPA93_43375 [Ktedonosporobacter rubrisoli]|uniref:Uncharacterized protein n=1 Tax=Ktedonosporobacter rubrisoli TaxID=2509675 RepID=A0A4P6K2L1_KTERU|nr:hypothetical protein [Ktedonosporobacter rubrisoli]QBD82458.1 hypothetical protein EPA93_43375 [Ktedonosporobacter rubrisoli]
MGSYEYYPLETGETALLPQETELVINTRSGHALLIDWERRVVGAEMYFAPFELPLIQILLHAWPSYVEYSKCIRTLIPDPRLAEQFVQCIGAALETQNKLVLNVALEPLRTVLYGCNERLNVIGLEIAAVYESGYLLTKRHERDNQEHE